MKHFRICDQCNKPTLEEEINVIILPTTSGKYFDNDNQYYCPACFQSVTYDVIHKNKKNKNKVNSKSKSAMRVKKK